MEMSERKDPKFIDRENELRLVKEPLHLLHTGHSVMRPVLYIYGVRMVGKTTLLNEMQRLAARDGVPVVVVDFGHGTRSAQGYSGNEGRGRLMREMMSQLETRTDAPPPYAIVKQDLPEQAALKVLKQISRLHEGAYQTPVALFFDTLESAASEDFNWLQKELIQPALNRNKVFVVFAGRLPNQELEFHLAWPLRTKIIYHHLAPFGQEDTVRQLKDLGHEAVPLHIHSSTGGIPGINNLIASEQDLSSSVYLLSIAVEDILRSHLREDTNIIKELLFIIFSFRWFDDLVLAKIAYQIWPDDYKGALREGTNLASKLQETMLIETDTDGYGYTVVGDLRGLFDRYQLERFPEQKFVAHKLGYSLFKERVNEGAFIAIADLIYHLAGIWSLRDRQVGVSIPDDIPIPTTDTEREAFIMDLLQVHLRSIKENTQKITLIEKLMQIIKEKDFQRFLSPNIGERILIECQRFLVETTTAKES